MKNTNFSFANHCWLKNIHVLEYVEFMALVGLDSRDNIIAAAEGRLYYTALILGTVHVPCRIV